MSGYSLLSSVRVLEVAQLAPSSVGGYLADLGADVVKIETPGAGDGVRRGGFQAVGGDAGPGFLHLRWNRGKRSFALDLRNAQGKEAFLDLVACADIVIEGTRAGYLERLGLGVDVLSERQPTLVYCTISGTGQDGPYRNLGTGGLWFDSYAGLRDVDPDHPSAPGVMGGSPEPPIAMYALGAYGAVGVLAALHRAKTTGQTCNIEVASIDVAASWMPDEIDAALNPGTTSVRPGWTPDGRLAHWPRLDAYRTSDGQAIILQAHLNKFWRNFCAVDRRDLLEIDLEHVDEGHAARAHLVWRELAAIFRQRTRSEWVELFLIENIAGGPVNSVTDLLADPHYISRDTRYSVDGPGGVRLTLASSPIRSGGEKFAPDLAPELGAHSEEVLKEVAGYDNVRAASVIKSMLALTGERE